MQGIIAAGRQDADFDLFCRRVQMTEIFSSLPPNALNNLYLADFYADFWKLAGDAHRTTKFAEQEKNIAQQLLNQLNREQNPVRRQYLALALIIFDRLQEAQNFIDQSLWSPQLKENFATFINWRNLAYNPLTPQSHAKIARNDQIMAFLKEKFSALIQKYSQATLDDCPRVEQDDYQIYFCWLQGEAHLPPIIRCCYNSLKQNAGHYKIVFLDEKNFSQYVDIAPHIMDKFRAGKISRTHFSDILRVNLLEQYGGLWLDSTVLVTEPLENHRDFWQMPYFSQKFFHDKNPRNPYSIVISYGRWASFIQGTAIRHNPLFTFEKNFLNEYWRDFDKLVDYLLIDFIMALAYDNIPAVRKEFDAVPINNTEVWTLLQHLNNSYAAYPFDKILAGNFLHKLSWKDPLDMTRNDTVFREIQRRYAPETI